MRAFASAFAADPNVVVALQRGTERESLAKLARTLGVALTRAITRLPVHLMSLYEAMDLFVLSNILKDCQMSCWRR